MVNHLRSVPSVVSEREESLELLTQLRIVYVTSVYLPMFHLSTTVTVVVLQFKLQRMSYIA